MPMTRTPFTPLKLEEERKEESSITRTVRIDKEDLIWLKKVAIQLRQEKLTTALKQAAYIGYLVLQDEKMAYLAETVFKNERRNERIGVREIEPIWGSP